MKLLFRLILAFLIAGSARAGVIASQPPSASGGGFLSARFGVDGSGFDEFVWDSFSSATNQTVREIQWRGTRSGSAPASFEISINTVALPGGTTWQVTGNANETPTATPGVYDYRFTLPAGFAMTGGQTYWLQVFAVQNEMPNWQWSAATGGNGTHFSQVPAVTGNYRFITTAGDVAFSVLDAATVPITISLAKSPSSGGTVTGGGTFSPGANVTVNATPANGRTFLSWTEAGTVVSTSASFTFPADGNKTLTANFSGPNTGPYMITAVANPGIYGNVGGAGSVQAGEIRELDISAVDGVSFVGWTENGVIVNLPYNAENQVFEVTATADRNLVANFSYLANSFFINGTVSPASSGTVVLGGTAGLSSKSYNGGTPITITATPANGYKFMYWRQGAGLGDLGGPPRIVSTNPVLNHIVCYGTTLTAVFEPHFPVLSLTSSPVAGGTVTGGGVFTNGANVTVNATPAIGYAFASWRIGTTVMSTDASYTFPLSTHTTLRAFFEATNRTITATAVPDEGGSVDGAGVFGNGATVTLTATAAPGYYFSEWILDGQPVGSVNPATFEALGDYTFEASFSPLPALSIEPGTSGGLSISWPATFANWVLQESPDLNPASWAASTLPVGTSGGQNKISIAAPTGSMFFRLARP